MDKALTWFIGIWVGLVLVLNLASIAGFMLGAESIWQGVSRIQDAYGPHNLWTHGLNIALLSPAVAADTWRRKRRERSHEA